MASASHNTVNEFALKLYRKMVAQDQNFFISPYSISTALQMCYVGARENTAKQLSQLLCLRSQDPNDVEVLQANQDLIHKINHEFKSDKININVANKIYQKIDFKVKQDFLDKLAKYFETTVESVDFSNNVQAAKKINSWVEEKTNNRIKDLVSPDVLDALTRLVLVNAIYFKGTWDTQFKKDNTQKQEFHLASSSSSANSTVQVEMMKLYNKRFHLKIKPAGLDCATLELPYAGRKLSMTIILPNKGVSVTDLEPKLTPDALDGILENRVGHKAVNVHLPKFKFTKSVELSKQLIQMGAPDPFSEKDADFTGINQNREEDLCISKVIHQAFVEVNEEGTEAAAATAVVMRLKCAAVRMEEPPYEFICDRPFLFLIHENHGNTILFMGKCVNPNS